MTVLCYRKKAYRTQAGAMTAVYGLRARGVEGVQAYRCEKCGKYHVQLGKAQAAQRLSA